MKKFEIWMEGYATNGEHSDASLLGIGYGETFENAVKNFYNKNPDKKINFDPERMTHWGCGLFPNEVQARKSFG